MATNKPANISSKIWAALGDVETPTDAKIETGWQAEVPKAQVENWVQNRQDAFNAHVNERGIAEWDATTDYIANKSYVQDSLGTVYRAVQNTGPSTVVQNPTTDGTNTYWTVAFAGGSLDVYTKGQSDARFVKNSDLKGNIRDYGARSVDEAGFGDFDSSLAIQACADDNNSVYIPEGEYLCSGVTLKKDQYIYGPGRLRGTGTGPVFTVPVGATGVTFQGIRLSGRLLLEDSTTLDSGIVVNESGVCIQGCIIEEFTGPGINLQGQVASAFANQSVIQNSKIRRNGVGIVTNAVEYCRIDGNVICENGWNADKTGVASGVPMPAGIFGNLANCPVTNNQIGDNVFGIYLVGGSSAPNPDHSIIGFNSINHNGAAGVVLVDLKNYELVVGNTIISNVNIVPSVVYPATGTTVDIALVNAHGLVFTGNAVGTGSDNKLSIYGHGRCRYTNNIFLYGPPTEIVEPMDGSPLKDIWGYNVNQDNIWKDNWFFAFDRPVLLPSTIRTTITDNLENSSLVDGVRNTPTLQAGWSNTAGYDPLVYKRENGNTVRVSGTVTPDNTALEQVFTLPVGFRPPYHVMRTAISSSGAKIITVYSDGGVFIQGFVVNEPIGIDITFTI